MTWASWTRPWNAAGPVLAIAVREKPAGGSAAGSWRFPNGMVIPFPYTNNQGLHRVCVCRFGEGIMARWIGGSTFQLVLITEASQRVLLWGWNDTPTWQACLAGVGVSWLVVVEYIGMLTVNAFYDMRHMSHGRVYGGYGSKLGTRSHRTVQHRFERWLGFHWLSERGPWPVASCFPGLAEIAKLQEASVQLENWGEKIWEIYIYNTSNGV